MRSIGWRSCFRYNQLWFSMFDWWSLLFKQSPCSFLLSQNINWKWLIYRLSWGLKATLCGLLTFLAPDTSPDFKTEDDAAARVSFQAFLAFRPWLQLNYLGKKPMIFHILGDEHPWTPAIFVWNWTMFPLCELILPGLSTFQAYPRLMTVIQKDIHGRS